MHQWTPQKSCHPRLKMELKKRNRNRFSDLSNRQGGARGWKVYKDSLKDLKGTFLQTHGVPQLTHGLKVKF